MGLEEYLEERLDQVGAERAELLVRIEEIRNKMKRAEAKRAGEDDTPNHKKWSSILRGLEHDLDRHRAMLTTLESESKEKHIRLSQLRTEREPRQDHPEDCVNRIDTTPAEELAPLTPDDKEPLQECGPQPVVEDAAAKETPAPPQDEKLSLPAEHLAAATAPPEIDAKPPDGVATISPEDLEPLQERDPPAAVEEKVAEEAPSTPKAEQITPLAEIDNIADSPSEVDASPADEMAPITPEAMEPLQEIEPQSVVDEDATPIEEESVSLPAGDLATEASPTEVDATSAEEMESRTSEVIEPLQDFEPQTPVQAKSVEETPEPPIEEKLSPPKQDLVDENSTPEIDATPASELAARTPVAMEPLQEFELETVVEEKAVEETPEPPLDEKLNPPKGDLVDANPTSEIDAMPAEEMTPITSKATESIQELEPRTAVQEVADTEEWNEQVPDDRAAASAFRLDNIDEPKYIRVAELQPQDVAAPTEPPIAMPAHRPSPVTAVAPSPEEKAAEETPIPPQAGTPSLPLEPVAAENSSAETEMPPPSPPEDEKTRRRKAFQSALDKSRNGSVSEMTFEEVAILLTAYRKLTTRRSDRPGVAELEANVSGAMWKVQAQCARICANWAELVRQNDRDKR